MTQVTSDRRATVTLPSDEEILITRDFDAPRHLVYKAWTTPELVERWWAGRRGRTTSVEMDFRVGGRWRYVLVANEGFEVAFNGEYREIVPEERIVYTEMYEGAEAPPGVEPTVNIATFTEIDGGTRLELLSQCHTKELRDMIVASGFEVGMQEQMEIIEELARSLR
jgi:uncharacterized protein YndB with AHSA1/START domain